MNYSAALNQYKKVGVETGVVDASPHKMIEMLLKGITDKIAFAKGAIQRKDVAKQGENISKAIRIVDTLRASLDQKRGGEIASNLYALYDYIERRLTKANMDADASILDEVTALIDEMLSAWGSIPAGLR
jgi:flagellar secretion chaperone FliS